MSRIRPLARRYGFDLLIVLAAIAIALEVALADEATDGVTTTRWFAAPAAALVVLPLLARRQFPFAAPVSVWLAAAVLSFVDGELIGSTATASVAGLAAAFLLGNLREAFPARVGLAAVVGGAAIIAYNNPDRTAGEFVFVPALFAIGWLAGYALRERAAQAQAAEDRATVAELEREAAERERETAARIAVAEERARIARELHDIVAHAVSVMVLQVGAVRHKLRHTDEESGEALRHVEEAGRRALAEMRRLLGAMREEGLGVELAPQPGLDGLASLMDEVRRAGLPVHLHVDGERFALPRAVDLSAYRIVQEGLTNALKYARASRVDVALRYSPDEVSIEVRDDGVGATKTDGHGHGLVGMRERVKIYGGEMTAGPAPEGGFVLTASLPVDGREQ
jgi:signal transduction histidine kinase